MPNKSRKQISHQSKSSIIISQQSTPSIIDHTKSTSSNINSHSSTSSTNNSSKSTSSNIDPQKLTSLNIDLPDNFISSESKVPTSIITESSYSQLSYFDNIYFILPVFLYYWNMCINLVVLVANTPQYP